MKGIKKSLTEEYLYLDFSHQAEGCILPLHTSVTLFLLSYCDCKIFKVCLVLTEEDTDTSPLRDVLSQDTEVQIVSRQELPPIVQNCCLPAVVEQPDNFCRAGLAVVLRHIAQKAYETDPSKKEILELLGFKKTCLKACAEVSQWTRLCELTIPLAIENFLRESLVQTPAIPMEILELEKKLREPVVICKKFSEKLTEFPLLASWYQRIQEVPRVQTAASKCGIQFLQLPELSATPNERCPHLSEAPGGEEQNDPLFTGGPRPTMTKLLEKGIEVVFSPHPCPTWTLDWNGLPAAVSPKEGRMSSDRALRKQQQLNNLVYVVINQAKPGDRIVDFCSGGGHVGLVLAHVLPSCQGSAGKWKGQMELEVRVREAFIHPLFLLKAANFSPTSASPLLVILIENKELSLIRAKKRSDELGLSNIWFIQANMEYFAGMFNIGVALHACGVATDMVIEQCIKTRASFVTCPCCYGFIQNTSKFNFPKSEQFKKTLSYKEHMVLCRFADQTAVQLPPQRRIIGKQCMCLVDLDRARAAEEHGYSVQVISMEPESCSPKNNMIVGVPV
ncbi:glutathione S-transferase C-terminal domain-containing protein isoform X5 [Fukomys damarensis]|uniref:glutathione S-transferase C-terminal domain-containing protein isoform X5 n=1 Tax=Fukomys damarensis TaxID=885580 RepID=UPI000540091C|nr:glutathione S-transferase C-terminal domain-containing protein isoform X5 [Fukomys damarensis]